MAQEQLILRGTMRAHTDWVTAIATPIDNSDMIVTSSRDKSLILWTLTKEDKTYGVATRRLTGHSHFVQDVVLSSDGQFALSGSWDGELRLWDLQTGATARRFVGHTKDVLSVAFSVDNRQIVSASRDKTIRLWNTLGECKYTIQDQDAHSDWVSCVRFSPSNVQPTIVSGSWDRTVKIWNLTNCKLRSTLAGHAGYVNTVAVSPDGSLCASGGKDGVILLWDLAEGKRLYSLDAGSIIHSLCFSPNRYWLCAATEASIKIWDLESKSVVVDLKVDLKQESEMAKEDTVQTGSSSDWTREEDKAFENALAVYYNDADRWDKIALAVPGKTIEDLKLHYEALSDDVVAIESGKVPLPHYPSKVSVRRKRKKSSRASVQRGIPWTEEEHRRFLYGLQRFGRGDWKSISRYSVRSKSNSQVASHAQKYFKRLNSANEGKRPSINDIRSVQPENLLALEKATTSCMPGNRKKASTNAGNQLLCRYPKEASTNTGKQLFSEYPNEASTNAGNQLLCRYPKEASTNTGKQLFSEYPNEASTNARNQLLTGYPKEVSTNVGNQLFPKYPKEASTNAGNQLLPGYPKEVSINAGYQLFPGYPTEASTNAGNPLLPPTPFAGMSTTPFSAQAIAGPCTSAAVVPPCSMFTPPFASRPIQEPGPSVGMPTYYPTVALMQDGGILPPAGSFDVPSTSYSEYEIIDLDMFVFPHFLD